VSEDGEGTDPFRTGVGARDRGDRGRQIGERLKDSPSKLSAVLVAAG
jgi:hypothetical protein